MAELGVGAHVNFASATAVQIGYTTEDGREVILKDIRP